MTYIFTGGSIIFKLGFITGRQSEGPRTTNRRTKDDKAKDPGAYGRIKKGKYF